MRKIGSSDLVPGHSTPGMRREDAFVLDDLWSGRVGTGVEPATGAGVDGGVPD